MRLRLSKGELKEDIDEPLTPGESVFSDKTWEKLIRKASGKDEKNLIKTLKISDKRVSKK